MQNRFGLKDFVVIVLLLLTLVALFLSMKQNDRLFEEQSELEQKIDDLSTSIAIASRRGGSNAGFAPSQPSGPAPVDTSWARPGVEIVSGGQWAMSSDPYDDEGFRRGGEFVEIYEGQPNKLTPYRFSDVYGRRVNDLVLESLGWYDPNSLIIRGRLAEAWQYDDDGMWLRVKIRDEANFSDGTPVEAHDVVFTYHDVIFNQLIEADRDRSVYYNIEKVEALSDKVVEFTFKNTNSENFSQGMLFRIMPQHFYEEFIEAPTLYNNSTALVVGSGPFKFETMNPDNQWSPGEDIRLVRNENYWGPVAPLEKYRITVVSDNQARLTEYRNGSAHMVRPSPEQIIETRDSADGDEFLSKHDERVWYNMRGGYSFLAWQCGERPNGELTPFADRRVRRAMTHLIDRDRIIRDVFYDMAKPRTGPFGNTSPQSNTDIEPWPYDEAKAVELLAEAGWIDRDGNKILENEAGEEFEFTITFSNGSEGTRRMANYLRAQCAKVGIKCELDSIDWAIMTTRLNTRAFDCITLAWSASKPESDPNQLWHSDSIEGQGDNFTQWSSPTADDLIERGRTTVDFDERMAIWHQLHQHIHEEQPYTFIAELPWRRYTSKQAKNVNEYNSGLEYHEFWMSPAGAGATISQ